MSLFDLIFLASFLGAMVYAVAILVLVFRRRWAGVRRHSSVLATGIVVYLLVLAGVGILAPRRVLAAEQILRYDDWCLGVEKVSVANRIGAAQPAAENQFVVVTYKVISEARRARQAAPQGSLVYLLDAADNRYDVSDAAQAEFEKLHGAQPALTTKLDPQSSFLTVRVFEIPRATREIFVAHRHGTGFPAGLIIGEGLRKPRVLRIALP